MTTREQLLLEALHDAWLDGVGRKDFFSRNDPDPVGTRTTQARELLAELDKHQLEEKRA